MTELSLSTRKKQTRSKSASHANITTYFWKVHWRSFDNEKPFCIIFHYKIIHSILSTSPLRFLKCIANLIEKHMYKKKKTPNTTNGIENRKTRKKGQVWCDRLYLRTRESGVVTWESHQVRVQLIVVYLVQRSLLPYIGFTRAAHWLFSPCENYPSCGVLSLRTSLALLLTRQARNLLWLETFQHLVKGYSSNSKDEDIDIRTQRGYIRGGRDCFSSMCPL